MFAIIPGSDFDPNIVYVLPAPVAPYAKIVELNPYMVPSTMNFAEL